MTKYRDFLHPSLWWLFADSILVILIFLMGAWIGRDIIKRKITLTWDWNIGWERKKNPIVIDNFVFIACNDTRVTLALPAESFRGLDKSFINEHCGPRILNKITEELFEKYRPNIENVLSTDG